MRLDSLVFSAEKLDKYLLNDYTGETELTVGASYDINPALVSLLTLTSKNSDGTPMKIYAVYIGDKALISQPTQKIIVFCHGRGPHLDYYWPRAKLMANAGGKNKYGVLMIDYQGWGMSEGKPGEQEMVNDLEAAMGWLKTQGATGANITLYGYSLGSYPAVQVAAYPKTLKPGKLVLEAPLASAEIFVQDSTLLSLPGSYFVNLKLDNLGAIGSVTQPLLWLHGTADSTNPFSQGKVVYDKHNGAFKQAVIVSNGEHTDLPILLGYTNYLNILDTYQAK